MGRYEGDWASETKALRQVEEQTNGPSFACSYLRRDLGLGIWRRRIVVRERFPTPCRRGKNLRFLHADHGGRRDIPCLREAPIRQYRWRNFYLLSHSYGVAHGQAQRR